MQPGGNITAGFADVPDEHLLELLTTESCHLARAQAQAWAVMA
jgi:hypothetical protein